MSDAPKKLPPKKEVALALLEASSLFVHLDPRRDRVVVPKAFMKQPQLVLQVGLDMAVRIPDLEVDEEGISCTLSFSRRPFWCSLPWSAIFALVSEDGSGGMIWPDDVPAELAMQVQKAAQEAAKPKRPKPRLAAVGPDGVRPDLAGDDEPVAEAKPEPAPEPLRAAGAPERRPALAQVPLRSASAPEPPAARPDPSAGGEKKPRREIPPYLRVVK